MVVVSLGITATDLGTLGGNYSKAYAINASGQVAGYSKTTGGDPVYHATLWNGTTATDLGTLGGTHSYAYGINDSGQVVGYAYTTGNAAYRATLWNGTTATDLGALSGGASKAYAINASGQVAGYSYTSDAVQRAALWNGTTIIDLNSLLDASTVSAGWVLNVASGINDNGWIAGTASNSILGISSRAFLLSVTSVPEPETYGMMLTGLGMLGFMARRRKNDQA
jgi:probable HAF family extracellular repeat protein